MLTKSITSHRSGLTPLNSSVIRMEEIMSKKLEPSMPKEVRDRIRPSFIMPEGVTIPKDTFQEIIDTLEHARVFITSRQKMHKTGVSLYDKLISNLKSQ